MDDLCKNSLSSDHVQYLPCSIDSTGTTQIQERFNKFTDKDEETGVVKSPEVDEYKEMLLMRNNKSPKDKLNTYAALKGAIAEYEVRAQTDQNKSKTVFIARMEIRKLGVESFGHVEIQHKEDKIGDKEFLKAMKESEQRAALNFLLGVESGAENGKNSFNQIKSEKLSSKLILPVTDSTLFRREVRISDFVIELENGLVFLDLERVAGSLDSPLLQLGSISGGSGGYCRLFSKYVHPIGKIDKAAADRSHKIELKNGNLTRNNQVLPSIPIEKCLEGFLSYLAKVNSKSRHRATIVSHGKDYVTFLNILGHCGLLDRFCSLITGWIDFVQVLQLDTDLMEKSDGCTTLFPNPRQRDVFKIVTGKSPDRKNIHDALDDSKLLRELFWSYLKRGDWIAGTLTDFYKRNIIEPPLLVKLAKSSVDVHVRNRAKAKQKKKVLEFTPIYGFDP